WRDDDLRREQRHGLLRHAVGDVELDRHLVTQREELGVETLRQAVERMSQEQDAHQQILGSCSPVSQSTTRRPPKLVSICTKWCGSSPTLPMIAAPFPSGWARIAASRPSASSGAQMATSLPSLA